jgi:hypothetical protein
MEIRELLNGVTRWSDALADQAPYWADHLPAFADRIQVIRPKNVTAVVAVPPRQRIPSRGWLRLVTIATGRRTEFALIHLLAKDLAPTVLQTGIVPIVEPWHEETVELLSVDAPAVRFLLSRGSLLYERD